MYRWGEIGGYPLDLSAGTGSLGDLISDSVFKDGADFHTMKKPDVERNIVRPPLRSVR